jgi:hypothetical protein
MSIPSKNNLFISSNKRGKKNKKKNSTKKKQAQQPKKTTSKNIESIDLTKLELIQQLGQQVNLLNSACEGYDRGNELEALNIALRIRVLLHDTDKSHSVFHTLGIKARSRFYDSSTKPNHKITEIFNMAKGMITIRFGENDAILPKLYDKSLDSLKETQGFVSFDDWWNRKIIVDKLRNQGDFSRSKLIKDIANKLGGAHVDTEISPELYNIIKNNYYNLFRTKEGIVIKLTQSKNEETPDDYILPFKPNTLVYAVIRQIGYEVLVTIKNIFKTNSDLCPPQQKPLNTSLLLK